MRCQRRPPRDIRLPQIACDLSIVVDDQNVLTLVTLDERGNNSLVGS